MTNQVQLTEQQLIQSFNIFDEYLEEQRTVVCTEPLYKTVYEIVKHHANTLYLYLFDREQYEFQQKLIEFYSE